MGSKTLKKLRWNVIGYIMLLVIAGALLYHMCHSTNQAMNAIVVDMDFVGEYSMDGGDNWKKTKDIGLPKPF